MTGQTRWRGWFRLGCLGCSFPLLLALGALAAVVVMLAGCGTRPQTTPPAAAAATTTAATPSPSPSPTVDYAAQYLADVKASNAEGDKVNAYDTANPYATIQQQAPVFKPLYTDLVAMGRNLLHQQWPVSAQADVHALAIAVEAEANDIYPPTLASGYFDQAQFDHDNSDGIAAAEAVRADLGLPPSS